MDSVILCYVGGFFGGGEWQIRKDGRTIVSGTHSKCMTWMRTNGYTELFGPSTPDGDGEFRKPKQ